MEVLGWFVTMSGKCALCHSLDLRRMKASELDRKRYCCRELSCLIPRSIHLERNHNSSLCVLSTCVASPRQGAENLSFQIFLAI
jgi:hypothetical protein